MNDRMRQRRGFWHNGWAAVSAVILAGLYLVAAGADFFAPYAYDDEDRDFSYCQPMAVRFVDDEGVWQRPFVYGVTISFDPVHRRVYALDKGKKYPLRFFVKSGEPRTFGVWQISRRLVGVDAPGRLHLLGADSRGRDLLSRIIYGGRVSLSIGLICAGISFIIGLVIGGIAGFYGGRVDEVLMRVCEMLMMVPGFYVLLALRSVVPANFTSLQVYISVVVILSLIGWAGLARIIRGMCLSLRERDFVLAAKAMGVSDLGIIIRHILPHTLSYSLVAIMLAIPGYILAESALSLIGLGIQDPYASWGNLLSEGMGIIQIHEAPWIILPGVFILITVMCFNVVGDAVRDSLDPTLGGSGKRIV